MTRDELIAYIESYAPAGGAWEEMKADAALGAEVRAYGADVLNAIDVYRSHLARSDFKNMGLEAGRAAIADAREPEQKKETRSGTV